MIIETKQTGDAVLPHRAHLKDAGYDLYAIEDRVINVGEVVGIKTGISMHIPAGFVGLIFSRSGHGKKGIRLANSVGVVDPGYQGEIIVLVTNDNIAPYSITKYERIAQMVFVPFMYPELKAVSAFAETTDRAEKGFGSTG